MLAIKAAPAAAGMLPTSAKYQGIFWLIFDSNFKSKSKESRYEL